MILAPRGRNGDAESLAIRNIPPNSMTVSIFASMRPWRGALIAEKSAGFAVAKVNISGLLAVNECAVLRGESLSLITASSSQEHQKGLGLAADFAPR
ncbi:hypothetical protein ON010_g16151 [Phytophthora cinnamomi]|nr:hypothetical protein ON010_g16151 [Phytophthora cinnamomi]